MNQQNTASGWQQTHTHFIWLIYLKCKFEFGHGNANVSRFFLLLFLSFFAIAVNDDFVN